jgi:hypothetical protein
VYHNAQKIPLVGGEVVPPVGATYGWQQLQDDNFSSFAHTQSAPDASITLDLGSARTIDELVVQNRSDPGMAVRILGCELQLLDEARNVIKAWAFKDVSDAGAREFGSDRYRVGRVTGMVLTSEGLVVQPVTPPPPPPPSTPNPANLIKNGTFETPRVVADTTNIQPTDWDIPSNANTRLSMMMTSLGKAGGPTGVGLGPTSTPQFLVLTSRWIWAIGLDERGIDLGPYVEQTLTNLIPNKQYKVSFFAMNYWQNANELSYFSAYWDDTPIMPKTPFPRTAPNDTFGTVPLGPFVARATRTSHKLRTRLFFQEFVGLVGRYKTPFSSDDICISIGVWGIPLPPPS